MSWNSVLENRIHPHFLGIPYILLQLQLLSGHELGPLLLFSPLLVFLNLVHRKPGSIPIRTHLRFRARFSRSSAHHFPYFLCFLVLDLFLAQHLLLCYLVLAHLGLHLVEEREVRHRPIQFRNRLVQIYCLLADLIT